MKRLKAYSKIVALRSSITLRRRFLVLCAVLMQSQAVNALSSAIDMPLTEKAVVKQASLAIHTAFCNGVHRQQVKLPLSESMYSKKEEGFVADRAIGWQGGQQETYRFLQPLATSVLQEISLCEPPSSGGLVAKVEEQVLLDFDGSSLLSAQHPAGPRYDIQAMLQPNTDDYYMKTIQSIEVAFSDTPGKAKRLFLLVNATWRDKSSWGFFGAAKGEKQILNRYEVTYALDQFVVRGRKMSLLKAYPHEWAVFLEPMPYETSQEAPRLIGTFTDRPKYDDLDDLLLRKSDVDNNK